jgi:sec-independent protein translocase protein TatC
MLGVIAAFPYIIYEIWKFVRPALYEKEKKSLGGLVFSSIFLFYFGASFGYFVLAPFSINFLGNFSLGEEVSNVFTVTSFIEILTGMVLWSGVIFEIPMAAFFLARIGLLNKEFLAGNRKYAIVIALILAAIITPSGDVFSLSLVALPLWILYEVSIVVVKRVEQRTGETTS